jgi:hypothetical protein
MQYTIYDKKSQKEQLEIAQNSTMFLFALDNSGSMSGINW